MFYVETSREKMINWLPKGGSVAEVGVFKGVFSRLLTEVMKPKELRLVDLWKWEYYDWDNPPASELGNIEKFKEWARTLDAEYDGGHPDVMLDRFHRDIVAFGERQAATAISVHKGRSVEIAQTMPDKHFDMIYIDADHHYDPVLADLVAWAPSSKTAA